jgi:hypothetical protein
MTMSMDELGDENIEKRLIQCEEGRGLAQMACFDKSRKNNPANS